MSKIKNKFVAGVSTLTILNSASFIGIVSFLLFGFGIPGSAGIFATLLAILAFSIISIPFIYRYYKKHKEIINFPFSFFVSLFFLLIFFALVGYMIALFVSSFTTHLGAFPIIISSFGLLITLIPCVVLLFYTISTIKRGC